MSRSNFQPDTPEFWAWVAQRPAHQTQRGAVIREVRELLKAGRNPGRARMGTVAQSSEVLFGLRQQYRKELQQKVQQ